MSEQIELDYELTACLNYNPQPFAESDIAEVLAVWEGQNDGDDWRWILRLKDGRFVFLQGGCDYTGWDCQSWAHSSFHESALVACEQARTSVNTDAVGIGHMLSLLSGEAVGKLPSVYESLVRQINAGKNPTWRESKDAEFGISSHDYLAGDV